MATQPELEGGDQLATKSDLLRLEMSLLKELRKAERWMVGIQVAYFFGTLASVWFLVHFR
jgi:hypothetical protein